MQSWSVFQSCAQREDHQVGKLELKRWVSKSFLKDVTEGLLLIMTERVRKKCLRN